MRCWRSPENVLSKPKSEAARWMAENAHSWATDKKHPPQGPHAKKSSTSLVRKRRGRVLGSRPGETIKVFVEANRNSKSCDCIFVPAAQEGTPARIEFLGRNITAARYMLLLTQGAPESECMLTRHLCGNGHLSCVNPNHLAWGLTFDNASDASKHRAAGENVQDRIHAID